MDPKRVLIVEPDGAFGLSLASLYRSQGRATAVASGAADAEREIAALVPDLVVVRAELPDLSGFSLCGRLRRDRPGLPLVLFSSESTPEALAEHARTSSAADAYLTMPLDTEALLRVSNEILASPAPVFSEDALLEEVPGARAGSPGDAPAPAPGSPAPPPVPRRVRHASVTDDDRVFVERTFRSIADRRAALVAESHRRRPPPPRQLLATPEGKLSLLREELKAREAQIARLSEIWEARDEENRTVDARLHEKEVELQSLKLQVDELLRRLDAARDQLLAKEQEHGASIEGLLLDKFSQEKELIEVVAAKERRINELEREVRLRDDDLAKRKLALDAAVDEISRLERQAESEREAAERRERDLTGQLGAREGELGSAQKALAEARSRTAEQAGAARAELQRLGAALSGLEPELAAAREREAAAAERARELEERSAAQEAEHDREREAARQAAASLQARIDEREQAMREREERVGRLEGELRAARAAREADQAAFAQRSREWDARLAEERRRAQEEIQRRDAARAQDAQRYQAVVQDAARRIEALQAEVARRGGAPAAARPAGAAPAPPGREPPGSDPDPK